jgi:DNA sulfur modification protein DndC
MIKLEDEFRDCRVPFRVCLLSSLLYNRFFVRIIGRGYPPPTNSFRWCTKNLRIAPVASFINRSQLESSDTVIVLGLRRNESQQRDRTLVDLDDSFWQKQKNCDRDVDVFLPIINLSLDQVWDAIFILPQPSSIDPNDLEKLYRGASAECPIIKPPQSAPCAAGRFGCWTCTVVRKDRSSAELINAGHKELQPFLDFRNWLAEFRNNPRNRCPARRSGMAGLGPFSIEARKEILLRVNELERKTKRTIISVEELRAIRHLWRLDSHARLDFRKIYDEEPDLSPRTSI